MSADVLIVGGGLMGCATAIDLARHGKSVMVIEKDVPGRHASGHNSGGVRCQGRDLREVVLAVESRKMWDDHPQTVGSDCGFHISPRLRLAENNAEMAKLEKRHAELSALGFAHEVLADREEVRRLSPRVSEHIVGGLVCHSDGLANPMQTSKAYAAKAESLGVTILSHTSVVSAVNNSRGFVLRTDDGKVHEGAALVNAAGAWAGKLSAMLDDPVPVTPAAPTMMVTARVPGFMNGTSLGLTGRGLGLMAAHNGTIIVGGGYRSPFDFDKGKIWIDSMQMARAAKMMVEILPELRNTRVIRFWSAFEGTVADKVPIIGESVRVSGLFHVCGFSAHGFQLAPAVGRVMSQLIRGVTPEISLTDFRPSRFAD